MNYHNAEKSYLYRNKTPIPEASMDFYFKTAYNSLLKDEIAEYVNRNKIVHIEKIPESVRETYYVDLARGLGYLFRKDYDPINKVLHDDKWTEVEYDERYIHQTYKHSNKSQPLHTDYCNSRINLDLVVLICEQPAEIGGATVFIDSRELVRILEKYNPELLSAIESTTVLYGKSPSPVFNNTATILTYDEEGEPMLSWNYAVVSDNNPPEVLETVNKFHDFLETFVSRSGHLTEIKLAAGDVAIFHDRYLLHGRNSFFGYRKLLKGGIMTRNIEENLAYIKNYLKV